MKAKQTISINLIYESTHHIVGVFSVFTSIANILLFVYIRVLFEMCTLSHTAVVTVHYRRSRVHAAAAGGVSHAAAVTRTCKLLMMLIVDIDQWTERKKHKLQCFSCFFTFCPTNATVGTHWGCQKCWQTAMMTTRSHSWHEWVAVTPSS